MYDQADMENKLTITKREAKQEKTLFEKVEEAVHLDTSAIGFNAADLSPSSDPGDPFSQ